MLDDFIKDLESRYPTDLTYEYLLKILIPMNSVIKDINLSNRGKMPKDFGKESASKFINEVLSDLEKLHRIQYNSLIASLIKLLKDEGVKI